MIGLFAWATPNGPRSAIMLEEIARPYTIHLVDLAFGVQFAPEFPAISPTTTRPAGFRSHAATNATHST